MPTSARISPFAATAASLPSQDHPTPNTLPALEDIQCDLDELLILWDCARASGEDITHCRIFRRVLEQAAGKLDEVCQQLREAGHE